MQCLTLKKCWDTQASLLHKIMLRSIACLRSIVSRDLRILAVELGQLLENLLGLGIFFRVRAAASASELIDFFFERHALEKIRDAQLDWQIRIAIRGLRFLGETGS